MAGFKSTKKEHTFYFMEVINMPTFRKHGKGWQVRVSWYDDDGNRHYTSKAGFKTKMVAKAYALELEQSKTKGTITSKNVVFSEYFVEWFKIYKQNKIAPVTADLYRNIANMLKQEFGKRKIDKISRREYQLFMNSFGETHAKSTVQKVNSIIRACVKSAIYDNLIATDFTQNIELIWDDNKTKKIEYLNVAEISKLVAITKRKLNHNFTSNYMILTAIYTGMRQSEIAALTWDDINFNWQTITVNKSWDYRTKTFKNTKNESSKRIIKVTKELLDLLSELKRNRNPLVFVNQYGTIPSPTALNKELRKLMQEANINKKGYHFHSIRHSHVALLLYKGVDLYAVSKRLGHSDITMTAKKYAYLIDELRSKADKEIDTVLSDLGFDNETYKRKKTI